MIHPVEQVAVEADSPPVTPTPGEITRAGFAAYAGVRHCLSAYVDVHAAPKTKAVPIGHIVRMVSGPEFSTGAAVDGFGQTRLTTSLPLSSEVLLSP